MLVCVGYEDSNHLYPIYIDTDDLDDAEYHYYRKARLLERHDAARKILTGLVKAAEIESNPIYEFLRDKEKGNEGI